MHQLMHDNHCGACFREKLPAFLNITGTVCKIQYNDTIHPGCAIYRFHSMLHPYGMKAVLQQSCSADPGETNSPFLVTPTPLPQTKYQKIFSKDGQRMPLGSAKSVRRTAGTCEPQHSETQSSVIYISLPQKATMQGIKFPSGFSDTSIFGNTHKVLRTYIAKEGSPIFLLHEKMYRVKAIALGTGTSFPNYRVALQTMHKDTNMLFKNNAITIKAVLSISSIKNLDAVALVASTETWKKVYDIKPEPSLKQSREKSRRKEDLHNFRLEYKSLLGYYRRMQFDKLPSFFTAKQNVIEHLRNNENIKNLKIMGVLTEKCVNTRTRINNPMVWSPQYNQRYYTELNTVVTSTSRSLQTALRVIKVKLAAPFLQQQGGSLIISFNRKGRADPVVVPGSPTTQQFLGKSTGMRQARGQAGKSGQKVMNFKFTVLKEKSNAWSSVPPEISKGLTEPLRFWTMLGKVWIHIPPAGTLGGILPPLLSPSPKRRTSIHHLPPDLLVTEFTPRLAYSDYSAICLAALKDPGIASTMSLKAAPAPTGRSGRLGEQKITDKEASILHKSFDNNISIIILMVLVSSTNRSLASISLLLMGPAEPIDMTLPCSVEWPPSAPGPVPVGIACMQPPQATWHRRSCSPMKPPMATEPQGLRRMFLIERGGGVWRGELTTFTPQYECIFLVPVNGDKSTFKIPHELASFIKANRQLVFSRSKGFIEAHTAIPFLHDRSLYASTQLCHDEGTLRSKCLSPEDMKHHLQRQYIRGNYLRSHSAIQDPIKYLTPKEEGDFHEQPLLADSSVNLAAEMQPRMQFGLELIRSCCFSAVTCCHPEASSCSAWNRACCGLAVLGCTSTVYPCLLRDHPRSKSESTENHHRDPGVQTALSDTDYTEAGLQERANCKRVSPQLSHPSTVDVTTPHLTSMASTQLLSSAL
ncbi:hypothetical protein DV515_00000222 [Chloebia gouldiae]|uniref:Uncharacterized protein n=1 Tax=Chloebia gouldiae TaxID=44316 RepID=A0A3L8T1J8_CHLGU|nr:hypothetical protein DV515_00000222 [Chloebia gouldiae]